MGWYAISGEGFPWGMLRVLVGGGVFVRGGVGDVSKLDLLSARQLGTECKQTFAIICGGRSEPAHSFEREPLPAPKGDSERGAAPSKGLIVGRADPG